MDVHNGPSIYNPKSLPEFLLDIARNPNIQYIAGGTDLMRQEGFYPNPAQKDLLNLDSVPEFSKVIHTERFLDVGPMVTLAQLLSTGSVFLSKPLRAAIDRIGTTVVRNMATVGGALCSENGRSALACYLAAAGAQAELRILPKKESRRNTIAQAKWVPVSKLYEPDLSFVFPDAFISKIRIPSFNPVAFEVFTTIGSVYKDPANAVVFSFIYTIVQKRLSTVQLFIQYPIGGFLCSPVLNEALSDLIFPFSAASVLKISDLLEKEIREICPSASELQIETSKRLLVSNLNQANIHYLEG